MPTLQFHGADYVNLSVATHYNDSNENDDDDDHPSIELEQEKAPQGRHAIGYRRLSASEESARSSSSLSLTGMQALEPLIDDSDLGNQDEKPKKMASKLAWQAFPSLVVSVIGLIMAGVLMDRFQYWDLFINIPSLFILLPILLNLKGNLEMNLASRFSTLANLGELDHGPTKRSLVVGNLALLQVQALVAGAIAGLASFALGLVTKPDHANNFYEIMYMIASAMVSASVSSAILGIFMCGLILLCRRFDVNPDNIACPMASATGDVVTLLLLAGCAFVLQKQLYTLFSMFVFLVMACFIPFFGYIVWHNTMVKSLMFSGWTPIMCAMIISSMAGVLLEEYVEKYKGVALLTPVLIGLAGNLGSIYASRISTCLHAETQENYRVVELTLLAMNIPVQIVFLLIIWGFRVGDLNYNFWFFFSYFVVSMVCTWICLKIARYMTLLSWKMGYDPDNYVIPYLTACIDVIGTVMLVAVFSWLTSSGADNMALHSPSVQ